MRIDGQLEIRPLPADAVIGLRDNTVEAYAPHNILSSSELLRRCRDGCRIVVTTHGVPVATIVALEK